MELSKSDIATIQEGMRDKIRILKSGNWKMNKAEIARQVAEAENIINVLGAKKAAPKQKTKPNVEKIFTIFQKFNSATAAASRNIWGGGIASEIKKAQETFKKDMEKLGLAEHIDWTDLND